jgi:hypothetical protein
MCPRAALLTEVPDSNPLLEDSQLSIPEERPEAGFHVFSQMGNGGSFLDGEEETIWNAS